MISRILLFFVRVRITLALLITVIIILISFSIHSSLPYILMSSTGITETPPLYHCKIADCSDAHPPLGFFLSRCGAAPLHQSLG